MTTIKTVPPIRTHTLPLQRTNEPIYDQGRVHYFVNQLQSGVALDPIEIESNCFNTRGRIPDWGGPLIIDGHHRFAAHALLKRRRISFTFGGVVTTRDWLTGELRRPPPEVIESV